MGYRNVIVTGLPGEPGAVLPGSELIAAVRVSTEAKAAGLEGKIFLVDDDGKLAEFNTSTKQKGAQLAKAPWAP